MQTAATHRGALPSEFYEQQIPDIPELPESVSEPLIAAQSPSASDTEARDEPAGYAHVRSPEARRSSALIVLSLSAVCGAVAGAALSLSGKADAAAAQRITELIRESFGKVFAQRALTGAAFLTVEYLLGFFAFGDLLVWIMPLCAGMGLALRVAVSRAWALLPSSVVMLLVITFAAALSSGFSAMLMHAAKGGTVYLGSSPRRLFTLNFLGCLAAVLACALYEGLILNV